MDMVNTLRVGQRVVCISNGSGTLRAAGTDLVLPLSYWGIINAVKGTIYTIRGFLETAYGTGLLLEEIDNSHVKNEAGNEPTMHPSRFRPFITKTLEEDSEMFRKIGNDAGSKLSTMLDILNAAYDATPPQAANTYPGVEE